MMAAFQTRFPVSSAGFVMHSHKFHSGYASKVVRGLGAGIMVRNVAWFVFDKGLSEQEEALALEKEQLHRIGIPKMMVSVPMLRTMVRRLRATYFRSSVMPIPLLLGLRNFEEAQCSTSIRRHPPPPPFYGERSSRANTNLPVGPNLSHHKARLLSVGCCFLSGDQEDVPRMHGQSSRILCDPAGEL